MSKSTTKIAICITTRNRPEAFAETLHHWLKYKPRNAKIFVVDDASTTTYCKADFRFTQQAGIPAAKNKCLELAYKHKADFIFLSDDDCYPISKDAVKEYVNSGAEHLSFSFPDSYANTPRRVNPTIKGNFSLHQTPNGCMIFLTKKCLETAGGFNPAFGLGVFEHADFTRRVYNLGLTPYPNMDLANSSDLFFSMDKNGEIERSFSRAKRQKLLSKNRGIYSRLSESVEFVQFM